MQKRKGPTNSSLRGPHKPQRTPSHFLDPVQSNESQKTEQEDRGWVSTSNRKSWMSPNITSAHCWWPPAPGHTIYGSGYFLSEWNQTRQRKIYTSGECKTKVVLKETRTEQNFALGTRKFQIRKLVSALGRFSCNTWDGVRETCDVALQDGNQFHYFWNKNKWQLQRVENSAQGWNATSHMASGGRKCCNQTSLLTHASCSFVAAPSYWLKCCALTTTLS